MTFEYEHYDTHEEVRKHIQECEGIHTQQAIYSTFHDALTQVCLYGEGYGHKIQAAGKLYIPDGHDFVLFDVKIGDYWLERENIEDIARHFGIAVRRDGLRRY